MNIRFHLLVNTSLFFCLFSCGNAATNENINDPGISESENEDSLDYYKEFYFRYEASLKDSLGYEEIIELYFYKPEEILRDTSKYGCFDMNAFGIASLQYALNTRKDSLKYYWNEEMNKTPYRNEFDPTCDCNVHISATTARFSTTICFYKGKIFSTDPMREHGTRCSIGKVIERECP
jgi:hypothetical protein